MILVSITNNKNLTVNNTGKVMYHVNNQYDEDVSALAMTGSLNTFDDEVTEKLNQRIADIRNGKKVDNQTITGESATSASNWWPW